MRDFGESLLVYRPPIDTRSVKEVIGQKSNGNQEKALNFLTPHQKWGIHSTYSDNLLMLTLGRGGPVVCWRKPMPKIWVSPITTGLKSSTATVL